MASLLTDDFVRANGLPADAEGQKELLAGWHKRKTAIYKEMVRAGKLPGRPGIARIVDEALAAGWTLAVASTSAEESVRAVLEHVVGRETAARFQVFAGDVVPAKKPDPAIYLLALERMGVARDEAIVVEDSRNGLLAAVGAGLRCVVTVSRLHGRRGHERGGPRRLEPRRPRRAGPRARQPQRRAAGRPGDARRPRGVPRRTPATEGGCMSDTAVTQAELVVRTIAQTAVDNEKYFCDLDAVVGDGDFGYSLARGFEIVLSDFDDLEYEDAGGLLKKTALVLTKRIGGTSGPIWGTAFLRAGATLLDAGPERGRRDRRAARRHRRHQAARQLRPRRQDAARRARPGRRQLEASLGEGAATALERAAVTARESAEATKGMLAKRGRASYTGDRSRDSVDAGAVGVAVMFEAVSKAWRGSELEPA